MAGIDKASHLPLEIVDSITSHLRDDTDALRACTLLSARWTLSARRHLFEETSFRIDDPDSDLDAPSPPTVAASRLNAFARFLDCAPYVCDFVRQLQLFSLHSDADDYPDSAADDEDEDEQPPLYQVRLRDLFAVLHKLPALRTLVLDNVLWSPLPGADSNVAAAPSCPWIETLVVRDLTGSTNDFAQLGAIFHLLPGLADLTISWSQLDTLEGLDAESPELIPFPQHMRLRTLTVKNVLSACVLASLAHTDTVHTLRSLDVEADTLLWRDIGRMGTFIEAVGARLRHLRLELAYCTVQNGVHDESYVRNIWRDLRLSTCTALRTLHLETDYETYDVVLSPWVTTHAILDTLPTTAGSLQRLVLTTSRDGFAVSQRSARRNLEPRWDALEKRVLAFPALKSVRFVTGYAGKEHNTVDAKTMLRVKKKLSVLEAKGLLKFGWD